MIERTDFDRAPHKERDLSRRVFVVGMGMVTPLGLDTNTSWKNLIDGKLGISNIEIEYTKIKIAGQIRDFDPEKALASVVSRKDIRRISRPAQLSLAASIEALSNANLLTREGELKQGVDATRIGVCIGTGIGGAMEISRVSELLKAGKNVSPLDTLRIEPERVATVVSTKLKLQGPLRAPSAACATGNLAIIEGYKDIIVGDADLMVVGGTESTIEYVTLSLFDAIGALSRSEDIKASMPFDKKRNGFVMSECAAVLVLAELDSLKRMGLKPLAELSAYGNTADGGHDTLPSGEGAERAMRIALRRAGEIRPETLYINNHGTSTPGGDEVELSATRRALGEDNARKSAMSSTKGGTGHGMGGTGAMEAAFCIKAIQEGVVPPTLHLKDPVDEAEGLNLVPREAQVKEVETAMNNSFGFGGINSVTVFKRPE